MSDKDLRIVYMGTPDFAVSPLRRLVEEGYNVVAVVTMPDKPSGRGLKMQQSAVKRYALDAGLPVMQPEKLKEQAFVEEFRALDADLGIVIAFRMLPEVIWAMPKLGTFNLHASLLPQYRGAAPLNWAIINGERLTGVTTFMLDHEIDKGDILCQIEVAINDEDTVGTLHDKLMCKGAGLVVETIERIASGEVSAIVQSHFEGKLKTAPKIFKDDCRISWSANTETIRNLVRGLSPYPAAWTEMLNAESKREDVVVVKIFQSKVEITSHGLLPGTIISDGKKFLKVACADGYVFIEELQMAGKKRMSAEEFLRGFKNLNRFFFQ